MEWKHDNQPGVSPLSKNPRDISKPTGCQVYSRDVKKLYKDLSHFTDIKLWFSWRKGNQEVTRPFLPFIRGRDADSSQQAPLWASTTAAVGSPLLLLPLIMSDRHPATAGFWGELKCIQTIHQRSLLLLPFMSFAEFTIPLTKKPRMQCWDFSGFFCDMDWINTFLRWLSVSDKIFLC